MRTPWNDFGACALVKMLRCRPDRPGLRRLTLPLGMASDQTLRKLERYGVWEVVNLQKGMTVLDARWVYQKPRK
jgi:hypothetical protein